jgi:membrane protease YdiL (CAAX protease family)
MSLPLPPRPDLADRAPIEPGELRRVATWRWWEVVVFTLLGFVAGVIAAVPLFIALRPEESGAVDGPGLLISAVADVVMAGVLILWLRASHPGWPRVIGWPPVGARLRELAIGTGFGVVLEVVAVATGAVVAALLESLTGRQVESPVQVSPDLHGWGILMLVLLAVVVAPVVEEFVFRGLLFRSLADRYGFWIGAVASAVPFGLTHVAVGASIDLWALRITLTVVGLVLAWIHWRRRNLLANIVAHATFNVIGVVIILAGVGA